MKQLIFILFLFYSFCFADQLFYPLPKTIQYDTKKASLGKELFFDPLLSKNKDIACISCHHTYGIDNRPLSIGTDGKKGFMNSISIFNAPYKTAYFWNGRSSTLKEQMIDGPLFNEHEMANNKDIITKSLQSSIKYSTLFQNVYSHQPTFDLMLDALVEFQKALITKNSKFDRFLRKETQLDQEEKKGMELFINYGCVSCHNGINIGGNSYQKLGSIIPFDHTPSSSLQDRSKVTLNENDRFTFLVPSLRNVEKTFPYFHNGSIKTLREAIQKMAYHNIGTYLTQEELTAIESFLKTFTGEIPEILKGKQ